VLGPHHPRHCTFGKDMRGRLNDERIIKGSGINEMHCRKAIYGETEPPPATLANVESQESTVLG